MFRVCCKYALPKVTSTVVCSFLCIDACVCVLVLDASYRCVADATVLQPFILCAVSRGATLARHEAVSHQLCNSKFQRT